MPKWLEPISRRAVSAVLGVALVVEPLAAHAQSAGKPVVSPSAGNPYQPQDKDERGLWMEIDEAERNFKSSPLIIRDPELNTYVRSVLCRVAGDENCRNVRLYIMRTPHFNASMAPNGMMQVWSGLLLRCQNEAQLAAVLGHEYAHYENLHSIKLFRDVKSKSASAAWLAFTGIGLLASFGLAASFFKYSRDMEHEADVGGLSHMAAAGYDTREASQIWERLREEMDATAAARNVKSRKDKDNGLFASHPPTVERVAYLREQAAREPGSAGANGAEAYRVAMARFWPDFLDDQLKMNDFGASDYLIASLASSGWSPWLYYARGELYRRRAGSGDLDQAVGFYSSGIEGREAPPELWRGRGLARIKLGNSEAGKADLREYLNRAPAATDRAMIEMMTGEQG